MPLPSFTTIVSVVFVGYILNTVFTVYQLFKPPACNNSHDCINPYIKNDDKSTLQIFIFTSLYGELTNPRNLKYASHLEFKLGISFETEVNITLPARTLNNGSLYIHAFLASQPLRDVTPDSALKIVHNEYAVHRVAIQTAYFIPEADAFNLLSANDPKQKNPNIVKGKPVTHWRKKIIFSTMSDILAIPRHEIPGELIRYIKLSPYGEYLPLFYVDELGLRIKDLNLVTKDKNEQSLSVGYNPVSYGRLRFMTQISIALQTMSSLGFNEKDLDEVKGIFADINSYLLISTFIVSALHLLFDFLAFKNDITFWRKKKTMVGLSTRSVIWRCVSQLIILLYLMDENTSLLVLIPAGIGSLIEVWKVKKAFKINILRSGIILRIKFGKISDEEKQTEKYDAQSMKYLWYIMYPLCCCGAIYSLLYMPHKSWYSWTIQSLVNGVYAFGFLFMLPQLFVNYRMKSVAHLPWRTFMYKAFNTFIDDVFAFIITMPTAHRVACFRDDAVFLIYLYQKWLYPVDKTRVNEYGESFEEEAPPKKNK